MNVRTVVSVSCLLTVFACAAPQEVSTPGTNAATMVPIEVSAARLAADGRSFAGQLVTFEASYSMVMDEMASNCGSGFVHATWMGVTADGNLNASASLMNVCVPTSVATPLFEATSGDVFRVVGRVRETTGRTAIASDLLGSRIDVVELAATGANTRVTLPPQL
jgi:hypothetical protein